MCETIYKYQYLIDQVIKHLKRSISHHPGSIPILIKNPDLIDWNGLSQNPNAIHLLENNLDKINWSYLSSNPNAIHLLENNLDKIDWYELSRNENAIHLLENNLDKNVNWAIISKNPNAINILENNLEKINWLYLSQNPNGIHLLENNLDKLDQLCWYELSKNPNAIHILENNFNKICWENLSLNPNAINLLEANLDKVNWTYLAKNPNAVHIIDNFLNDFKNEEEYSELKEYIYYDIMYSLSGNTNAIDLIKKIMPAVNYKFLALNPNTLNILMEHMIDNDNFYDKIFPLSRVPNMTILESLIYNPALFDIDYIEMAKNRSKVIYYDLIEKALAPIRIKKHLDYHLDQGYNIVDFDFY